MLSAVKFQGLTVKEVSGGTEHNQFKAQITLCLNNKRTPDLDQFKQKFPEHITEGTDNEVKIQSIFNPFLSQRVTKASWKNIMTELRVTEKENHYPLALELQRLLKKAQIDESIMELINYTLKPALQRMKPMTEGKQVVDKEAIISIITIASDDEGSTQSTIN